MLASKSSSKVILTSLIAIQSLLPASVPSTPDIIVNATADGADFGGSQQIGDLPGPDGIVSLREAITAANNTPGPQVIGFNIPMSDPGFDGTVFTISPKTNLPLLIDDGATVAGATQTIFTGNTSTAGPEVVLNGIMVPHTAAFPQSAGFNVASSDNVIQDLVINNFQYGIFILGGSRNIIESNYIGTDYSGTTAAPNAISGIICSGANNLIKGNLLSGNTEFGIEILGGAGHRVEGNRIGTDLTGGNPLPNCCGISIENTVNSAIGGPAPGQGNLIAFNSSGDGISVIQPANGNDPPFGIRISGNSIFSNGDLGIDLGLDFHGDGVTPNDPGDLDIGPNDFLNFPVLSSALVTSGKLILRGAIDTPHPEAAVIEIFSNPVPAPGEDPSGHGEGAIFLGTARPNPQGKFTVVLQAVSPGTFITATATDATGSTSEFAADIEASSPLPVG